MDINESTTLLIREILTRSRQKQVDTSKVIKILSVLHYDVPKSIVAETVNSVMEREGQTTPTH